MEELTENAEEPDEEESKQSVQKLGKLQYKVRTIQFKYKVTPTNRYVCRPYVLAGV